MLGTIHKSASPEICQCNLCRMNYGPFTEHGDWKFRKNFQSKLKFLHIDETERINTCRDLEDLIGYCRDRVSLFPD